MRKVINPISKMIDGKRREVFIEIEYNETKGTLSMHGVEGPERNGDAYGSSGQINMTLAEDDRTTWEYHVLWDSEMMDQLLHIWDRWHLNGLKAGTPAQEAFIRGWKASNRYDYGKACEALKTAGLYEDNGYKYGTKWLKEEVPGEVIEWLESLPISVNDPAWV
jgi:hypothetical protein